MIKASGESTYLMDKPQYSHWRGLRFDQSMLLGGQAVDRQRCNLRRRFRWDRLDTSSTARSFRSRRATLYTTPIALTKMGKSNASGGRQKQPITSGLMTSAKVPAVAPELPQAIGPNVSTACAWGRPASKAKERAREKWTIATASQSEGGDGRRDNGLLV